MKVLLIICNLYQTHQHRSKMAHRSTPISQQDPRYNTRGQEVPNPDYGNSYDRPDPHQENLGSGCVQKGPVMSIFDRFCRCWSQRRDRGSLDLMLPCNTLSVKIELIEFYFYNFILYWLFTMPKYLILPLDNHYILL